MCGICGQYNYGNGSPVLGPVLKKMAGTMVHRGPDDEGYFLDGPLGLGFRRLSIIDLAGGHQPMSDIDETVWVVFNGEIYNYPELRSELEGYGHIFRTSSDTEVIVHGFKQWGQDVLNHLNGMFGLAVWDARRKRLTVARDPFGIKGIYYTVRNGSLVFGSEIRALSAAHGDLGGVDPAGLNMFLRYRYTPSPYTIYRDVRKLAAGTMITCEVGNLVVSRWYDNPARASSPVKSARVAEEELAELYRQAVERHLLSDVPLGLLLSGGMDSGLLLALMSLYGRSWRTFTVGYGKSFSDDELSDAEQTAGLFSSVHAAVRLDQETFESGLPKIVSILEEPIASSSIVPMYYVCRRAREDVKVALMGQGPDELFGGYRRHLGVRYSSAWTALPQWMRDSASSLINALPRNETLKRGTYSLAIQDRLRKYQQVLSLVPAHKVNGLFRDGVLPPAVDDTILDCWKDFKALSYETDELGGFQFLELRSTLPDELLMYADKLSMAHGLEVRVPYLDKEIVEYVERLPSEYKVRLGQRKWLHRRVCRRLLPADILRRKKRGFAVNVVDGWFGGALNGKMQQAIRDGNSRMYQYLLPSEVQDLFNKHVSGQQDNHKLLFSLIVFEEWLRNKAIG